MPRGRFRKGVCIVLTRQTGTHVLVCHRIGSSPDEGWQFPQGGVDPSLPLVEEAKRELREEIGTDAIVPVRVSEREYCYRIPLGRRRPGSPFVGQCHRWVLARLTVDDGHLRFDYQPAEFDRFQWVEPAEALVRVVEFKRAAYAQALVDLGLMAFEETGCVRGRRNVK